MSLQEKTYIKNKLKNFKKISEPFSYLKNNNIDIDASILLDPNKLNDYKIDLEKYLKNLSYDKKKSDNLVKSLKEQLFKSDLYNNKLLDENYNISSNKQQDDLKIICFNNYIIDLESKNEQLENDNSFLIHKINKFTQDDIILKNKISKLIYQMDRLTKINLSFKSNEIKMIADIKNLIKSNTELKENFIKLNKSIEKDRCESPSSIVSDFTDDSSNQYPKIELSKNATPFIPKLCNV
jgi:hypothetical protein